LQRVREEKDKRLAYLDVQDPQSVEEKTSMREEDIIAYLEEMASQKPGYLETHEVIGVFEHTNNKRERAQALGDLAKRVFEEPHMMEGFSTELERQAIFAQEREDGKLRSLADLIEGGVDKTILEGARTGELRFGPDNKAVLKRWIEIMINSDELGGKLFEYWKKTVLSTNDLEAFADSQYVLAQIALESADIEEIGLVMNMYLGSISGSFTENEQLRLRDKNLAAWFDVSNDETLKKMLDVDAAFSILTKIYAPISATQVAEGLDERLGAKIQSGEYKGSLYMQSIAEFKKDPVLKEKLRLRAQLNETVTGRDDGASAGTQGSGVAEDRSGYPYNLMFDPEEITPLREQVNDYLQTLDPNARRMISPGVGECVISLPRNAAARPEFIKGLFEGHEGKEFSHSKIFETLAAQFPNMDSEKSSQMLDAVSNTKERLQYDARYLVSPRGDEMVVADPHLKETYGISKIAFIPDASVVDLKVRVTYRDGITCWCRLDGDYVLRDMDSRNDLSVSPGASLIWRDIILSHLEQVLCNKEVSSGGSAENESGELDINVRRPHMRKLGSGRGFTLQQGMVAMKDYGVDLHTYNRSRGLDREQGQFTFVREGGMNFDEAKKLPPVITEVGKVGAWQDILK